MKLERALLYIAILLLIGSNIYWSIGHYRTLNRKKYDITYDCEQKELIYSIRTFSLGTTYTKFNSIAKDEGLLISNEWENNGLRIVVLENINTKCPNSNRPYCGIWFSFKKDKLADIQTGYPCH